MERIRSIVLRPWRSISEAPDERARMGQIAGLLWMMAAVIAAVGAYLPGSRHEPIGWVLAVCALTFFYGLASATRVIHWDKASIKVHAIATLATFPIIAVAVYLMGNARSYAEALLFIPLLYSAFFFPRRIAWMLTFALLVIAGLPLITDPNAIDEAFLPRYIALCVGFIAATWVIVGLKERLSSAELRQREMANTDPLTGIANRRSFEERFTQELEHRTGEGRRAEDHTPLTLLILDLDGFKGINDNFGHPVGDAVLCDVADRTAARLRTGDFLARMGGDEFAVIAPGADGGEAERMATDVRNLIASGGAEGLPRTGVSVGWAVFPEDGSDSETLLNTADARMLDSKLRHRKPGSPSARTC